MSVYQVTATITCDACGRRFKVDLVTNEAPPAGLTLEDLAEEAVRGCFASDEGGPTSVQDGGMLCAGCTRAKDAQQGCQRAGGAA